MCLFTFFVYSVLGGCLCDQHNINLQAGIHGYYFDLSIFICERTTRVVYFTIDGESFKLVYPLYYWDDVAKIFNDGLFLYL
jgi:hypothetical protein